MEYKKGLYLLLSVGLSLLSLMACQSSNTSNREQTIEEVQIKETPLGKAITEGMEKYPTEDFYILHIASSDEYLAMSQEEYKVSEAFAHLVVRKNSDSQAGEPLTDESWSIGGKGKEQSEAMRIAYELTNSLEVDKNFEIYVEYQKEGTFTVKYRTE